jgi:zinc transport system ATP-binding protein
MSSKPIIAAENLSYAINGKQILKNISLKVKKGEIVSIIGPNGAGKTTLINSLLGLLPNTIGNIYKDPNLKIGYMPQKLHIDPILPLTVKYFLTMGVTNADIRPILEQVKIPHLINAQMHELSGGEHQRALLARALLTKPNLLVLDEPAQGVDLIGQAELYQLLADIRDKQQCSIIIVSHDLQIVMAQTDYVLCLQQHICCHGKPEQVSSDPAFIKLFGKIPGLALYAHQHDHKHNMQGEIIIEDKNND